MEIRLKTCCRCKLSKTLEGFHRGGKSRDGYKGACILCNKKARQERSLKTNGLESVFGGIKSRCLNKNSYLYHRYGGRGIKICDDWLKDPKSFYRWAMANGHKKGLQIDRIDNDGNYEPENCRFVTPAENMQNGSNAKLNAEKVREIRVMLKEGKKPIEISKIYNVDNSIISKIGKGKAWKNIV